MNVLVSGGAGYLGSVLVSQLIHIEDKVTVIDRLDWGIEPLVGSLGYSGLEFIKEDIVTYTPPDVEKYDRIVHLAAIVGEKACDEDTRETIRTNIEGLKNVCSWGPPVIFASTCSNYGIHDGLATEESPLNPVSLYATTKIEGEQIVLESHGIILRFGTLCGVSPRMRWDLLVNDLARSAVEDKSFSLYGINAWRPYLHIRDACNAIQEALGHRGPGVYNIVCDNLTKLQLIAMVQHQFPKFDTRIERVGDSRDYRVSGKKASEILGWEPRYTIQEAFTSVVEYAKYVRIR